MCWVGYEASIGTVRPQIQFFQDRLPDEDFITQDQGFFEGIPAQDLKNNRLRDADSLLATVGVFGDALSANGQAQLCNTWTGITERTAPVSANASAS